ncbi:MAG: RNA polymerase factor sigma-32 [Deltaproteobacteria bacterium]|nr:RNA polymerase factor sigma-32 [Deltaproteobacteria bacterium]
MKKNKKNKKKPLRPKAAPRKSRKEARKKDDSEVKSLQAPVKSALVKYDPLQKYLQELGQYGLLSREEEKELGIRVREHGDRDAAYRLVTSNLRLVVKIAIDFQRVWMQNLLDLIQEGNIGLMQAVQKFDPYKGVKFSYYASFWIKAYILKFIMDNWRLVKIGTTQAQRKLFFRLKKEKQRLASEGFDPKPKLLSERLGVTEQEVTEMDQRLDRWEVSLDAPIKEGSDNERIEFVPTQTPSAEAQVGKKQMQAIIHQKLASLRKDLSEREIYILENRVFSDSPSTLQEIGERYDITRERVRQIENAMIKKIKAHFQREIPDFESFLGDLD